MNTKSVSQSKHQEHTFPFADFKIVIFNSSPQENEDPKERHLFDSLIKDCHK